MFNDLKPYPEYMRRSVALGATPAHWPVMRLGRVVSPTKKVGHAGEALLSVYLGRGVIPYSKGGKRVHAPSEDLSTYQLVEQGNLVLNNQQAWRGSVGVSGYRGIVSPAYLVCRLCSDMDPSFGASLFSSPGMVSQYVVASKGVGDIQRTIHWPTLRSADVALPPPEEQQAIVTYLAHANQRINETIATKRRLMALLEERKQAVTRQAVTAGLGGSALRDSGFAHIGLVPAHWSVVRAKYLFREFDLRSGTGQEPLLSLRQATGLVRHDEVSLIAIQPDSLTKYKVVVPGAVVMNRMRAASGVFAVAREVGLVSPDYSTMTVGDNLVPDYYLHLFKTPELMAEFRRNSSGLGTGESGFMRLQYEGFGRIALPVPPPLEQQAIADLVKERGAAVDVQLDLARREIALLREFTTRLTADVVTGKLDVRGVAASLPEIDPGAAFAASDDGDDDDHDLPLDDDEQGRPEHVADE